MYNKPNTNGNEESLVSIFGILYPGYIGLLRLWCRCGGEFEVEYRYVNHMGADVTMTLYGEVRYAEYSVTDTIVTHVVKKDSMLTMRFDLPTSDRHKVDAPRRGTIKNLQVLGDSLTLTGNGFAKTYYAGKEGEDAIYDEASYGLKRLDDKAFRYTYVIE